MQHPRLEVPDQSMGRQAVITNTRMDAIEKTLALETNARRGGEWQTTRQTRRHSGEARSGGKHQHRQRMARPDAERR